MAETWRPIAGHDGYEISNLGRVRSLDRVVIKAYRGRAVPARYRGRVLKLSLASGYPHVRLGGRGRAYVHHMVLEAFVGPRPAGHQAAHGDGDRLNSTLANLRWASPTENNGDKLRHGTAMLGTRNPMGAKTHCKRGHAFDDENTRRANGRRVCRTCARESERRRRAAAVIAAAQHAGAARSWRPVSAAEQGQHARPGPRLWRLLGNLSPVTADLPEALPLHRRQLVQRVGLQRGE